jgi:hypothetical protein
VAVRVRVVHAGSVCACAWIGVFGV